MPVDNVTETLVAGDRKTLRFTVLDSDNASAPMDFAGYSATWKLSARDVATGALKTAVSSKSSDDADEIVMGEEGEIDVELKYADTANLLGTYEYQLRILDGDDEGNVVAKGKLVITARQ